MGRVSTSVENSRVTGGASFMPPRREPERGVAVKKDLRSVKRCISFEGLWVRQPPRGWNVFPAVNWNHSVKPLNWRKVRWGEAVGERRRRSCLLFSESGGWKKKSFSKTTNDRFSFRWGLLRPEAERIWKYLSAVLRETRCLRLISLYFSCGLHLFLASLLPRPSLMLVSLHCIVRAVSQCRRAKGAWHPLWASGCFQWAPASKLNGYKSFRLKQR